MNGLQADKLAQEGVELSVKRINGKPTLACHTHLDHAAETAPDGAIVVEPMGNMPVLKDLIVDMDAVHWKKMQRVTPWLLPEGDPPEREYVVQYQESDFDFVSRLLEEAGIYYFFEHTERKHTMVLIDGMARHKSRPVRGAIKWATAMKHEGTLVNWQSQDEARAVKAVVKR